MRGDHKRESVDYLYDIAPAASCGIGIHFRPNKAGALIVHHLVPGGISEPFLDVKLTMLASRRMTHARECRASGFIRLGSRRRHAL